jgi:hypothetical protein
VKAAALIILIPLVILLASRIGDTVPMLLFFASGTVVIIFVHMHSRTPWWVVLLPLGIACAYKMRRGDRRGVTGTRPVFRRRRP